MHLQDIEVAIKGQFDAVLDTIGVSETERTGINLLKKEYWWTYMRADAEGLDEIRRLSEAGKLKIPVEKIFPIAEVRKAHEVKEKRIIPGKVVLEVD
ncbi:Reticulon-4-interacting protein 1 [Musa troglodytarum]|uniref:Reticulon-4-interacting protein 1 n=1 Tax=Musa troglodytarum TaxID=320322 RepID=A0A9E7FA26_9LILI|nr:Reticulon-4-interacting protein 1 [Musa troglodytarum]